MYHQDDDYGMQLQKHKLQHMFVGTSRVAHLLGKTNGTYSDPKVRARLLESQKKFNDKYKTSICLTMIVRDEEKVILESLNGIYKFINYWVIVDTGSTDKTKELITNFFKDKNIPGELHERPWVNFGHNRTEAFDLANGKCDYMLVMDADDLIEGEPIFTNLRADFYNIRHGDGFHYDRAQVFKSGLKWKYVGVLHEAPVCEEAKTRGNIGGKYKYISRTMGYRSKDPLKYAHDAEILEAELLKEPTNTRYWFYLGQSYFDANNVKESKRAYAKRVELGGWPEECFYAQFRVAQCAMRLNEPVEVVIAEMLKAFNLRPTRAEPFVMLASYLRAKNLVAMGYPFALAASQLPYPSTDVLFVHTEMYIFRALDELAICFHFLGRIQDSYNINKHMLTRPIPDADKARIEANMKTQREKYGVK
jgi:glycosyltransferase involved in cell wall biosynthesis